jgi:hypothetical protein
MRMVLVILVVLGLTAANRTAEASFVFDLAVTGDFTGQGQISFETLSGFSVAGVDSFSFGPTTPGGFTFDLTDIDSVVWDFGLIPSMNLTADSGAADLSLLWFPLRPPFFSASLIPLGEDQLLGQLEVVAAAPEPATLGTAALCLFGMLAHRLIARRRAKITKRSKLSPQE